jgi:DNA polymerase-3 subunit beta
MIEFNTAELSEALTAVLPVVPARTPKPILTNLHIEAREGSAVLMATDGEMTATFACVCKVGVPETMLVPAAKLAAIVREAPPGSITLTEKDGKVEVKFTRGKSLLQTAAADEFPKCPEYEGGVEMPTDELLRGLSRVISATDDESTRYALGGVCFDLEHGAIVATDTRILVVHKLGADGAGQGVIPEKACRGLMRSMAAGGVVSVGLSENSASFEVGALRVFCRLLEGRFPQYGQIAAKVDGEVSIPVLCGPLATALRQVLVTTQAESRGVHLDIAKRSLVATTQASDLGRSESEVPVDFEGEYHAMFDPRFLLEMTRAYPPETTLELMVTDGESPLRCECGGTTWVVMPMCKE